MGGIDFNQLPDFIGWFAIWGIAVALLSLGYWIADYIWIERHSLHYHIGTRAERCSGAIGEIILFSLGEILLLLIEWATPANTIGSLLHDWFGYTLPAFILLVLIVYVYSIMTALSADTTGRSKGFKSRLLTTYIFYGGYSLILYGGGIIMLTLIIHQFTVDAAIFQTKSELVLRQIAHPDRLGHEVMKYIEISYLDASGVLEVLRDRMRPVYTLAAGIFIMNMLILYTPLRGVFLNNAVAIANGATMAAILIIIGIGGYTYIGGYSTFIDTYLHALENARNSVANDDWRNLSRYSDVIMALGSRRSLVGFITEMSNEWSGLAAILGSAQWALEQFNKPKAAASPIEQ
jgi:hypothetical protein